MQIVLGHRGNHDLNFKNPFTIQIMDICLNFTNNFSIDIDETDKVPVAIFESSEL